MIRHYVAEDRLNDNRSHDVWILLENTIFSALKGNEPRRQIVAKYGLKKKIQARRDAGALLKVRHIDADSRE
jgi:hypothetical protein